MIRKDKLNRIIRHLQAYKNTIVVPDDFKHSTLDELLQKLELEGYKVKVSSFRNRRDSICEHWTIELERGNDVK